MQLHAANAGPHAMMRSIPKKSGHANDDSQFSAREARGRVGVAAEMIRETWWWQHLEGARIKPVEADPVRFSVCVGAASRANSSERIVPPFFFYTLPRRRGTSVRKQSWYARPRERKVFSIYEKESPVKRMSKQYTRSEVASSNSKEKTLIILHDKVYDVTSFLNEHPGGEEILLDHGGKDGSEDFDDVGHSIDALELMKNYVVGELVEAERTHKKPKHWNANYNKDQKQEQGTSPLVMVGIAVAALAILYFVYL